MNNKSAGILLLLHLSVISSYSQSTQTNSGTFSLGTRVSASMFGDEPPSTGLGGQFRIQFSNRVNSEWFFDYITSSSTHTTRDDYHIGWSLMFYHAKNNDFTKTLQPYILAGHCFDFTKVTDKSNSSNYADRLSMAMQAGLGLHLNVTPQFDFSLSTQYMLHLGKEIETTFIDDQVAFEQTHSTPEGHLLATISINYKLGKLW